jgi:nitronate monooxygenase
MDVNGKHKRSKAMWKHNRITAKLGIEVPIIQAPMAGGHTTPQLIAAVSNSGGLGSLGAGYLSAEQITRTIAAIRELTDRPFAVNLFLPEPYALEESQLRAAHHLLAPARRTLGLTEPRPVTSYAEPFEEQFAAVLEAGVPVFSCTFGTPTPDMMTRLRQAGSVVIGTATSVREAVALEQCGVDLIVGQGSEAGGHRGTFLHRAEDALIGTMALIPQLADACSLPIIAAGGIMDGRGIAAALLLGAEAVQIGTAFLTSLESGTHSAYKQALLKASADQTTLTRAFSGKAARGLQNDFIRTLAPHESVLPPYPVQNALTRDIRQAAAQQNNPHYMSLWAGQGVGLSQHAPAAELMRTWIEQVSALLDK